MQNEPKRQQAMPPPNCPGGRKAIVCQMYTDCTFYLYGMIHLDSCCTAVVVTRGGPAPGPGWTLIYLSTVSAALRYMFAEKGTVQEPLYGADSFRCAQHTHRLAPFDKHAPLRRHGERTRREGERGGKEAFSREFESVDFSFPKTATHEAGLYLLIGYCS